MKGCIAAACRARGRHQLPGLGCGGGERLLANHVLAGRECVLGDREMQKIGSADVDRLHLRIVENLTIVRGGLFHPELIRELFRLFDLRLADRMDIDEAEPPDPFQMDAADEAGAKYRGLDSLHGSSRGK
jgi:hypothetical protein